MTIANISRIIPIILDKNTKCEDCDICNHFYCGWYATNYTKVIISKTNKYKNSSRNSNAQKYTTTLTVNLTKSILIQKYLLFQRIKYCRIQTLRRNAWVESSFFTFILIFYMRGQIFIVFSHQISLINLPKFAPIFLNFDFQLTNKNVQFCHVSK